MSVTNSGANNLAFKTSLFANLYKFSSSVVNIVDVGPDGADELDDPDGADKLGAPNVDGLTELTIDGSVANANITSFTLS